MGKLEQHLNQITLIGNPIGKPTYSHSNHGRHFYTFPLEVSRLSGAVDRLQILAPEELLEKVLLIDGANVCITGQIRSYNSHKPEGRRLIISVLAESMEITDLPHDNRVSLLGNLCKAPIYRRTPLGREICDIMLAVNRSYRRADYLPCILWGNNAREGSTYDVGTPLLLTGRLQSRQYIKILGDRSEERTAYEISAITSQFLSEEEEE